MAQSGRNFSSDVAKAVSALSELLGHTRQVKFLKGLVLPPPLPPPQGSPFYPGPAAELG